jgi:tripartite-type tricarboxylate transporter receptor subunit TctC
MNRIGQWGAVMLSCMALALTAPAQAQGFPSKPVRLVVPFAAGGPTDQLARIVAERMAPALGQPVVVENKPGANTQIGSAEVAKSAPDGYTVLIGGITPFVFNPLMYSKLPYDPKDLTGVAMLARSQLVLVSNPSVNARNPRELVELMKASPGKLNYGSAGNGNVLHLAAELFLRTAGATAVHVPFTGSAPALTNLLGGNIQFMFDVVITSLPHIKAGKLRALGTTGQRRSPQLPDVPTVAESGYAGYESATWFALSAPRGTPPEAVRRLNAAAASALRDAGVQAKLESLAMEAPADPLTDDVNAQTERDLKRWGGLIRDLGIRLD